MSDRRQRRPLYAPPPSRRQHSVLGFWVPLVITSTIALGGLAAWVWSERNDHDEDEYAPDKPPRPRPGEGGPAYGTQGSQPFPGPPAGGQGQGGAPPGYAGPVPSQSAGPQGGPVPAPGTGGGEAASYYGGSRAAHHDEEHDEHDQTFFGQVRGAMRRTPSPQQFLDHASKQVSAGIAAAGSALGSIMEDNESGHGAYDDGRRNQSRSQSRRREDREREGFSDHERWSEEADEKVRVRGAVEQESERRADAAKRSRSKDKGRSRRSVAIVVSADTNMDGKMDDADIVYDQHASILSHLPEHHNPATTDLFVLIYAPGLQTLPPTNYRPSTIDVETASNLGSSYSAVNTPLPGGTPAATPGEELQSISPRIDPQTESDFKSPGRQFDALYTQALSLVDSPTKILCFISPASYLPILRHLSPQLAYVSDLLSGSSGSTISQLKGWVGQTVLVVGDDGTGGLADSETEVETETEGAVEGVRKRREAWYEHSNLVGLGKGMEVVDVVRMGDDWVKRVSGRE